MTNFNAKSVVNCLIRSAPGIALAESITGLPATSAQVITADRERLPLTLEHQRLGKNERLVSSIAIRSSRPGGCTDPIQIQAQVLREWQASALNEGMRGFALMPDEAAAHAQEGETARSADWREADVKRAIVAAEEAGLRSYRIEIAPDGTISIVVGAPTPEAEAPFGGGHSPDP